MQYIFSQKNSLSESIYLLIIYATQLTKVNAISTIVDIAYFVRKNNKYFSFFS